MLDSIILKIIIAILLLHILYSIFAVIFFRNRIRESKEFSLDEITKRREILTSFMICSISLLLPYKAREAFVLMLHFLLHSVKTNVMLAFGYIAGLLEKVLFFLIYFLGLPATIVLKKLFEKEKQIIKLSGKKSSLLRRY